MAVQYCFSATAGFVNLSHVAVSPSPRLTMSSSGADKAVQTAIMGYILGLKVWPH
jgi:hypothetical protein